MVNLESAVTILDRIITNAINSRASDLHFEPTAKSVRVRFRIDGILHDQTPIIEESGTSISARIKVLAGLNTSEKRVPQDGKFSVDYNHHPIDIRVATFPCIFGERVVLRLLDGYENHFTLSSLGLSADLQERLSRLINTSQGSILVTGPTGSGKTTTLHSILRTLSNQARHVISLEDPVEYTVTGVSQAQIRPEVGFSFENALRAVLRQDPDVLMIGEIRDAITAHAALRAALTGHLVLSSVHTADTIGVIARLLDMGIEPFFISHALNAVVAQRLVRKLCNNCKVKKSLSLQDLELAKKLNIDFGDIYFSVGCESCNNIGYKGRTGIFEFLELSPELKSLLLNKPSREDLANRAAKDGLRPLAFQAQEIVNQGITSLFEIARVLL